MSSSSHLQHLAYVFTSGRNWRFAKRFNVAADMPDGLAAALNDKPSADNFLCNAFANLDWLSFIVPIVYSFVDSTNEYWVVSQVSRLTGRIPQKLSYSLLNLYS